MAHTIHVFFGLQLCGENIRGLKGKYIGYPSCYVGHGCEKGEWQSNGQKGD